MILLCLFLFLFKKCICHIFLFSAIFYLNTMKSCKYNQPGHKLLSRQTSLTHEGWTCPDMTGQSPESFYRNRMLIGHRADEVRLCSPSLLRYRCSAPKETGETKSSSQEPAGHFIQSAEVRWLGGGSSPFSPPSSVSNSCVDAAYESHDFPPNLLLSALCHTLTKSRLINK